MPKRKYFSGEKLRAIRTNKGMTREQLEEASGVESSHIGKIERNVIDPRIDTVLKLCAALEITPNELVGYSHAVESKTYTRTDFIKSLKGLDSSDYENLTIYVGFLKARKKVKRETNSNNIP